MSTPHIIPPPESGAIMTSRAEYFILNEESENPAIPREYHRPHDPTAASCATRKTIKLSNAASKQFFCTRAVDHEGLHEATRAVAQGKLARIIARWID